MSVENPARKRPRESSAGSSGTSDATDAAEASQTTHLDNICSTGATTLQYAAAPLDLAALEITRIIGWGGQATVWQACLRPPGRTAATATNDSASPEARTPTAAGEAEATSFAVKAFPRGSVDAERAHRERRALQELRGCPFVVDLVGTFQAACAQPDFQTSTYLCLCLELLPFDLYELLDTHGQLQESDARFYAACIVLALQHIHERGCASPCRTRPRTWTV